MDCSGIKKIIPAYIRHAASVEETAAVEEHLCLCNECRKFVGQLMDEFVDAQADTTAVDGKPAAIAEEVSAKDKEVTPASDQPTVSPAPAGPENAATLSPKKKKINMGDAVIIGIAVITILFFLSFLMR